MRKKQMTLKDHELTGRSLKQADELIRTAGLTIQRNRAKGSKSVRSYQSLCRAMQELKCTLDSELFRDCPEIDSGQREFITVWCNQLVDGRNRLRACNELGINCDVAELDESTDPIAYVLSHNLHRRHLSETQREVVAAKLAKLKLGDNQHTKEGPSNDGASVPEAASMLNVSVPSVERAKSAIKGGCKELVEAMERGEITSSLAARAREIYEKQAKERQGKRTDIKENLPECPKGQARDIAGKAFGVSGKSVDHARVAR